jgi:putative oxidoreductase
MSTSTSTRYLPVVGRVLLGAPFLFSGVGKLAAYAATVGYIQAVGLPAAPAAYAVAVVAEVGGGALLILGYRARPIALLLAIFSIATAVFFHAGFGDQNQMIHFLKNLMIAGGLLQIVHFGAGPLSVDAKRNK